MYSRIIADLLLLKQLQKVRGLNISEVRISEVSPYVLYLLYCMC